MENEKADRLRIMLQESLQPVIDRLERLEKEIHELKEQKKSNK
ncbi:hypothetical protein [Ornithinibacillus bavariensis]|uniref:Uncharacterized protein n=1 Tax=Ornithinibacillus bavariensis TaxID=545502 RepID=A0A919XBE9_9BACI|nr:hypothetical protein [Ornithinibacillus bavariensis]GIO27960.1 hypothetical protein J43TS3_25710 [Ornithinibacillus bavariensis]